MRDIRVGGLHPCEPQPENAMVPAIGPMEIMVLLTTVVLFVWPACRICARAGFSWYLGLMAALPLLNIALLFILAFAEWPALRGEGYRVNLDDLDE